jgi:DNA primase
LSFSVEVNQLSLAHFRRHLPSSWAQDYLADRFGTDISNNIRFQPGHAPAGWTNFVDHLRRHGVNDQEMLITGVATMATTGRLIDRFRDRVVFPIIHHGQILGFVGRRHPDLTDADRAGPKYLNTGDTPLFHKGAQLFGALENQLSNGAIPVIVEGPVDAIAVTLAGQGRYIGVAPLGTSLTEEQTHQFASGHPPRRLRRPEGCIRSSRRPRQLNQRARTHRLEWNDERDWSAGRRPAEVSGGRARRGSAGDAHRRDEATPG